MLQEPLTFLEAHRHALICIDEVQRYPELFPILRTYMDRNARAGQLLLLGSASPDMLRQSSESLAGRVSFIEIAPFVVPEVDDTARLWVQGGYPGSFFLNAELSFEWRVHYISTFLERDIPQLGITVPAETLRRLWTMLAHVNGSILNLSTLASSMGQSVPTMRHYMDILEGALVIRRLYPLVANTGKRLAKSPKVYIRDTGIIHCLLGVETVGDLLGHPCRGASFESFVIANILESMPRYSPYFYRSSGGAEIDLILER